MYKRKLSKDIIAHLDRYPAVAILGPRQIGKTTLAHEIAKAKPSLYLDLENQEDLQKLANPVHYLSFHKDKLIIIDEVQRYPNLFTSLRGIIDKNRREKNKKGNFLLLGSASNDLLKQSSESLAGRISYFELAGLNALEVEKTKIKKLWVRGGFPISYTSNNDIESNEWRNNFIKTYIERDIPQLGPRIPSTILMRFWTMLAHIQGELFNASKLAESIGVKSITISRYFDLMIDLMLVRRLHPWTGRNIKKRLVKSSRSYIKDSGILHSLLRILNYDQLLGHPILGKSWEGFVIENIISYLPSHVQPFFYRSSSGAEIDLILEFSPKDFWAIEIKVSRTPALKKGFHMACEDINAKRKFVVYTGEDTFSIGNDTTVMSLTSFINEMNQYLKKYLK